MILITTLGLFAPCVALGPIKFNKAAFSLAFYTPSGLDGY